MADRNYLVSGRERHYRQSHQSISHGQGGDQIVGGAVETSLLKEMFLIICQ